LEPEIAFMLTSLGYASAWLEGEFLDEAMLRQQFAFYLTGEDMNTEHYRYAAFRHILSSRREISNSEVEQYLVLAQTDSDRAMAQSALIDLLTWSGLTEEQFEGLSQRAEFAASLFQKHAERRRLLTALSSDVLLFEETFARCLASRDAFVQEKLLCRSDLTDAQLAALAERGARRAIRNIARRLISKHTPTESSG
jgi:hypothetical protein